MKKADMGFTLLELMITLLIGSLVLGIGIPSMINMIRNNRITAQANEFMTTLGMARGEALKRSQRVVVCRTSDPEGGVNTCGSGAGWQTGWIMFADTNSNGSYDTGEPLLLVHGKLSADNTLSGNNNVASKVTFLPQGVVGAGGIGGFVLADSRGNADGKRLICLGMTGRARVFSDGTSTCPD